ncbi:MAG: hypothetical protein AAB916_00315 [Patescibacteria group bacterium]
MNNLQHKEGLPWHIVEKAIAVEKAWLMKSFDFGQEQRKEYSKEPTAIPLSKDAMLRHISVSILRGQIRARELMSKNINGLWTEGNFDWKLGSNEERHGGEWHRAMMNLLKQHFVENNFEVANEPNLNWGRADLGVYKPGYKNLYVEVGSTSLFKVWFNSDTMPNSIFLFVPSTNYAIEFETANIKPWM